MVDIVKSGANAPRESGWGARADASRPWTWRQTFAAEDLAHYPARFSFLTPTVRDTLAVFHADPWSSFAAREIAKRAGGTPASSVHRWLRGLAEMGFLDTDRDSGAEGWPRYRANMSSPLLLKLFETMEVERRLAFYRHVPALRRTMQRLTDHLLEGTAWELLAVFLFGSWARGQEQSASDLDILLVFPSANRIARDVLNRSERLLEGSWKPSIVTADAARLKEGLAGREAFYQELWRDRVVVYGESVLWQIMGQVIRG